jgi:hypothetical protein
VTNPQMPVSEVPVEGFGTDSEYAIKGLFKDETVAEREKFEQENGYPPDNCEREFGWGGRGMCTRVQGHILSGDNGMHLAGNGKALVGAW